MGATTLEIPVRLRWVLDREMFTDGHLDGAACHRIEQFVCTPGEFVTVAPASAEMRQLR